MGLTQYDDEAQRKTLSFRYQPQADEKSPRYRIFIRLQLINTQYLTKRSH